MRAGDFFRSTPGRGREACGRAPALWPDVEGDAEGGVIGGELECGVDRAANRGALGIKRSGEILAEAGAGCVVEFGDGAGSDEALGPGAAELSGGNVFGVGGEDGQSRKLELGAEEMAQCGEDLVGLAGALDGL